MITIRTLTVAALASAALTLTACNTAAESSKSAPLSSTVAIETVAAPAPIRLPITTAPRPYTPAPSPAPRQQTPADYERAFIAVLDGEGIYYSTPAAAIELGHLICGQLDAGHSPVVISHVLGSVQTDAEYTSGDIGFIIGASIGAFCQEYSGLVN